MTDLLPRVLLPALVAAALAAATLTGCVRTVDGVGASAGGSAAQARQPSAGNRPPAPGIETTVPGHIPPNAFLCFPGPASGGIGTVAQVVAAAAPRITITLPDRWTSEQGHEDLALSLTGPDSMTGTVTIAATKLGPAAAFSDYADNLAHSKPDLHVEIIGAKFCGYSSQKLTGTFGGPSGIVVFADRITHIWTNTNNYLVAIHMEGPEDAAGFASAKAALMQEFAVVIP